MQAPDGNFYGTTQEGGQNEAGMIFQLSGNTIIPYTWFSSVNGVYPICGLAIGSDGNLWGTCAGGVAGNLYRITTNAVFTAWFPFYRVTDNVYPKGASPRGTLTMGSDGCLYGTTDMGGRTCPEHVALLFGFRRRRGIESSTGPEWPSQALSITPTAWTGRRKRASLK